MLNDVLAVCVAGAVVVVIATILGAVELLRKSFRTCAAKLTSPYQSHFLKRSASPSAHARATA